MQRATRIRKQKQSQRNMKILFSKEERQPKKLEKDIMLAFNKAIQKAGQPALIRLSKVGYL